MIDSIVNNLDKIGMVIIGIPMALAFLTSLYAVWDDVLYQYPWYKHIMYGKYDRDDEERNNFLMRAAVALGIANIAVPCLVITGFLYIKDIPFMEMVNSILEVI